MQMNGFLKVVKEWFTESIGTPSEPQRLGWEQIAQGKNVLICAPTGSGKTLAAFLKCLDLIYKNKDTNIMEQGIKVVYISPLKALNNDIYRNLQVPIKGIEEKAYMLGEKIPGIDVAVRTGDTPQKDRIAMLKHPPDILITTPESLFIMLTSPKAASVFAYVEHVIIDEIHSLCSNKRGVHLSVSIEHLEKLAQKPVQRIGLSATINPVKEVAEFLGGYSVGTNTDWGALQTKRQVEIVNCDKKRKIDINVSIPIKDFKSVPDGTIWPSVYAQLLMYIKMYKSTLIFVNNRKTAEMIASGINNLAEEAIVKTHHGSVSKEVRNDIERQLKNGEIPCLVATSSLELGIDVGHIEFVIQLGTPDSVSQVLQRIGRSGHNIKATSKGVLIPKTRADLLNIAFISEQVAKFNIEKTKVPFNCLDVLAQHIVSMSCEGTTDIQEIFRLVKGAYPYRELTYNQFEKVLLMLAYPSPEDEPGAIKPRIFYDRDTGKVKDTAVGKMICLLSGGVIPDKGNYAVYLKDSKVKLGELQEEFVFESRIGDRFFLGSQVWRLEAVEHDRIIVTASNESGAKVPFWIGDKKLRSFETGVNYGKFLRLLSEKIDDKDYFEWIEKECKFDRTAAENLREYITDQLNATGSLHNDKLILCEYFSDEVGDKRILIHTPFGGKIHAGLSIVLHSKLSKALKCEIEYIYNDDGMLFHLSGFYGKLGNILSLININDFEDEIIHSLPSAPIFSIALRYNITRSLLLNNRSYGKRSPLWIQRLRSAEVASFIVKMQDHPVVTETYRECINEIMDIKNLYKLICDIQSGEISVIEIENEKPSPFSSELLFNFWQIYQYVGDLPIAEKRNQLLVTDREFIRLAVGKDGEYDLLDKRAINDISNELRNRKYSAKIRNSEELYNYIYSYGELEATPYQCGDLEGVNEESCLALVEELEKQARIIRISLNKTSSRYWIAVEDYPVYCKALQIDIMAQVLKIGLPEHEVEISAKQWLNSYILELNIEVISSVLRIIKRYIRFIGPFKITDLTDRYSISTELISKAIEVLDDSGEIVKLKDSIKAEDAIYCHVKVYEKIKKETVLLARNDIKPRQRDEYCKFILNYQCITDEILREDDRLLEVIKKLQGMYLTITWWEDFVFPARVKKYDIKMLDYLCSIGLVRWKGYTNKNTREIAFFTNDEFFVDFVSNNNDFILNDFENKLVSLLKGKGALFIKYICDELKIAVSEALSKFERLVWNGVISNDSFSVVRYYMENVKKNSAWQRVNKNPNMGRWFLVDNRKVTNNEETLNIYVDRMLNRYGLINKDIMRLEKSSLKWSEVYTYLKDRELYSDIKRGFYISGFSGIQFARGNDIEDLRNNKTTYKDEFVTICASDPSNIYKSFFKKDYIGLMPRTQGTAVVFREGIPALFVKEYGNHILANDANTEVIKGALENFARSYEDRKIWLNRKNIILEYWGEEKARVENSPVYDFLLELGFDRGYQGVSYWRKANH